MADEMHGILFGNVQPTHQGDESFLREVISPIYQVMHKVRSSYSKSVFLKYLLRYLIFPNCFLMKEVQRNKGGTASHSKWRNYDDLNEYFW